ncbi:unnamed protein product [Malus baccata var. baccata]
MGGNMSHLQDSDESSDGHESRIVALHSKGQWNTHFAAFKDSNKLMVIDFTATWCGPCRAMEPILRDYADKFTDVEFVQLDVDELPDVAREFGVQAMPSFVFMKKGEVVDKIVGMMIDFTATWCGPCRAMEPILRDYADKFTDVEFVKLDVDELPDVAREFGVQAMPSFVFMKKGVVVDKIVGARKDELQKKIEKHRRS